VRVVVEERPRRDVLPKGGLGLRVEGLWGRGLGEREGREERRRRKRVSFFLREKKRKKREVKKKKLSP